MPHIIPNYHPMLIHFTIALTLTALGMQILSYALTAKPVLHQECLTVSRWCLWLSALASILTVIAGFHAYYTVQHDAVSHSVMVIHRNWGLLSFVVIELTAISSLALYMKKKSTRGLFTLVLTATGILIVITGWYGAELVFQYGLGVKSIPQSRAVIKKPISNDPFLEAKQNGKEHHHDHQH